MLSDTSQSNHFFCNGNVVAWGDLSVRPVGPQARVARALAQDLLFKQNSSTPSLRFTLELGMWPQNSCTFLRSACLDLAASWGLPDS